MRVVWQDVPDPGAFACAVLAREAPDIDPETMRRSTWVVEKMPLRTLVLAPGVMENQGADPAHVARSDLFAATIAEGRPIPPLIVVGTEPVQGSSGQLRYLTRPYPEVGSVPMLADGYHRCRALAHLGVEEAVVVRQRHALFFVPLFVVTGANGTGKSTVCPLLRRRLADCIVFEADVIPLPWTLEEWSERKATYRTACLSVALEIAQNRRPVVLVGTTVPEEVETNPLRPYFHEIHYLALVCDEEIIERRLRARPGSHTPLAADFETYLSTQLWLDRAYRERETGGAPVALVDVSALTPESVAERVAAWVRDRLPSST